MFVRNAPLGLSAAITADRYSSPFYVEPYKNVRLAIDGATTDTPVQVIKVQVCDDPSSVRRDVNHGVYGTPGSETAKWRTVTVPQEAVHNLGSGQAWNAGTVTWDGTAALACWIDLLDPGCVVRLWFDRTSGGTGNTPTVTGAAREG